MKWMGVTVVLAMASVAFCAERPTTSPVHRDGDTVQIENVPEVRWGKTGPCTLFGCLDAATSVTPRPVTYDALQVYSSVGFRIRWYRSLQEDKWHGVSPVAELPEEMTAIGKATGWQFDVINNPAGSRDRICKSIDEGLCVLGYVNRKEFDVGFVRGYEKKGERWHVVDYYRGYATVPSDELHDLLFLLRHETPSFSPREAMWHGINTAVQNWNRGEVPANDILPWAKPGEAKLCYGASAYEQMVLDISKAENLAADQQGNLRHIRAWVMDNIRDGRDCSSRFLSANPRLLGEDAEPHLKKAADIYAKMSDRISRLQQTKEAFAFMDATEWTSKVRTREIEVLKELSLLDEEAVGELEAALK